MSFLNPLKYLYDLPLLRERDPGEISRTARTIDRLDMEIDRRQQEFSGSVSRKELEIQQLVSFRDRLIAENVRKQAEPEIVRRNVSRTQRLLDEHWKSVVKRMPNPRVKRRASNNFTSVVDNRSYGHSFTTPRTVFGSEAWIARFLGRKVGHSMHLNPRFVTKHIVVPCIQRAVRKEVMFARGHAAKGHRGRRRPSPHGDVWC